MCILYISTDRCIIWKNRAIDDTSIKFGIQLGHALRKIFGYRAIADLSHNKNGSQKLTLENPFCCVHPSVHQITTSNGRSTRC